MINNRPIVSFWHEQKETLPPLSNEEIAIVRNLERELKCIKCGKGFMRGGNGHNFSRPVCYDCKLKNMRTNSRKYKKSLSKKHGKKN